LRRQAIGAQTTSALLRRHAIQRASGVFRSKLSNAPPSGCLYLVAHNAKLKRTRERPARRVFVRRRYSKLQRGPSWSSANNLRSRNAFDRLWKWRLALSSDDFSVHLTVQWSAQKANGLGVWRCRKLCSTARGGHAYADRKHRTKQGGSIQVRFRDGRYPPRNPHGVFRKKMSAAGRRRWITAQPAHINVVKPASKESPIRQRREVA